MDKALADLSVETGWFLSERSLTLATAESCTGGWVAQAVTHTAGSSAWFDRGFVTYSNAAKTAMLGVRPETLEKFGAVSIETAAEMAVGALDNSSALISLAITGIAGPTGGSPDKPVGTVCFAWCLRGKAPVTERRRFHGDREAVRRQSVIHALEGLMGRAKTVPSVP
ncbi:MAG: nicotinamide-nucleotide amidohydrolase family protein [Candidatus Nitricoxidivorans perseverans]|uniref:Nicotinamide-nucleotide amidohydrolase family protein n=1 Tax=Candidatus Nitricoxidivorans perseverans TaxID=2975601 RepID=A0AA49FJR8_9PROT|nr:MAG: nicotinamide-nucleotide amidohydrolase family protein [Candidatus Nitricoxidivorans perseverans]